MPRTRTPPHNRISPYLDAPQPDVVVPTDPATREAVIGDAVIAAVIRLRQLLASDEPVVALKAAGMILDLEKTTIRHGRAITGTDTQTPSAPPEPTGFTPEELNEMDEEERFEFYVELAQRQLQSGEDARGAGVVVTRAMAERLVRDTLSQAQNQFVKPPPSGCQAGGGL